MDRHARGRSRLSEIARASATSMLRTPLAPSDRSLGALRGLLAAAALVSLAPPARADEPPDSEALIAHGLELRRQHEDASALADFRRAYALQPTPRCRAQIGLAEQSLGQWLPAETDLRAALSAADDPWSLKTRVSCA